MMRSLAMADAFSCFLGCFSSMTTSIVSPLIFPQNLLPDLNAIPMHLPKADILWPSRSSTFFVVSPVHFPFSMALIDFASSSSPRRFFSDSGQREGMESEKKRLGDELLGFRPAGRDGYRE